MNKTERSLSLVKFVLVYLLLLAIPVGITYQLAKKSGGSNAMAQTMVEQQQLAAEMTVLQAYIQRMEVIDARRPAELAPGEIWTVWLQEAGKQNIEFKRRIDVFQQKEVFTGPLETMHASACTYLNRATLERGKYLSRQAALISKRGAKKPRT